MRSIYFFKLLNFPTGFEKASSLLFNAYEVFEQKGLNLLMDQESNKFLIFADENTRSGDKRSLKLHGCIWASIVTHTTMK